MKHKSWCAVVLVVECETVNAGSLPASLSQSTCWKKAHASTSTTQKLRWSR